MLFKLDENLHQDAAKFLKTNGHDATSVFEQGLRGHNDEEIASVCQQERRALVTLDLDFADVRNFAPANYSGIVVLRLTDQSRPAVLRVLERILPLFKSQKLEGCLWIVDEGQVRIRESGQAMA